MKIRWYEILILVMTLLCVLIFFGTYFATVQAPGVWISTEYSVAQAAGSGSDTSSESTDTMNGTKININTASQEELETLPGIGQVKAAAIIEYRTTFGQFESVKELLNVDGIGGNLLAQIRDYITVSDTN